MFRSRASGRVLFAFALLGFGAVNTDCARKNAGAPPEETGAFRFSLKLSSLATIDRVSYSVSGNGITPIAGMIDVTDTNVATAVIAGLPAGSGYSVSATAASTDGKTKCVGEAAFSIIDGAETAAHLILQCTGPAASGDGVVRIDGTFDNCPSVKSLTTIPNTAHVGETISLIATYTDLDGDPLTFSWDQNPVAGTFAATTADRTTFTCTAGGTTTLSFSVNDGTCTKTATTTVACLDAIGDGGASDAAAGGATGTGGATGVGSVTGTGGVTGVGGAGIGGATGVGGTGIGGATGTGGAGIGGATGVGGSGTGGSGAGGSGSGGAMACTQPSKCVSVGCEQCTFGADSTPGQPDVCSGTQAGCFNCDPGTMGCDLLTDPADKVLCENLYACLVAPTHPGTVLPGFCEGTGGDPLPCWCGTNALTCVTSNAPPTQANGPCLQQVFAAAKTTDAATINSRFIDPTFPLGAAANLAICRGTFCAPACSLP